MKYSAVALAAFVAVASAQDISIIPECALPCIDKAALKVCTSKDDYKCICEKKDSLVGSATTCVIGACGADVALQEVLPATETFCEEVLAGGDGAATTTAAATTSAAATSAAPSTSAAATSSAAAAPTSEAESSAPATTLAPSSSAAPAPSGNGTVSVSPPVSSSPVEAGAAVAGYIGSFGVAALAALAAF